MSTSEARVDARPRIFRVRYRSASVRRVADGIVKVPYSGMFGLVETLVRAVETNQVLWFRVDRASGKEIAKVRDQMVRWTEFLDSTATTMGVDFRK